MFLLLVKIQVFFYAVFYVDMNRGH